MHRSNAISPFFRLLLLLCCFVIAFLSVDFLKGQATAGTDRFQTSPLSPLETEPPQEEESPVQIEPTVQLEPTAAVEPAPTVPESSSEAGSAQITEAVETTLPFGEPLKAQISLFLVGLLFIGLVGLVVLIVIRQRQT